MAKKFEIVILNNGWPLVGFDGYIGIVAAGGDTGDIVNLTENTSNQGEYYLADIDGGLYDVYVDANKSGSFAAGDLFKEDVWHDIPDNFVTAEMTDFAYE